MEIITKYFHIRAEKGRHDIHAELNNSRAATDQVSREKVSLFKTKSRMSNVSVVFLFFFHTCFSSFFSLSLFSELLCHYPSVRCTSLISSKCLVSPTPMISSNRNVLRFCFLPLSLSLSLISVSLNFRPIRPSFAIEIVSFLFIFYFYFFIITIIIIFFFPPNRELLIKSLRLFLNEYQGWKGQGPILQRIKRHARIGRPTEQRKGKTGSSKRTISIGLTRLTAFSRPKYEHGGAATKRQTILSSLEKLCAQLAELVVPPLLVCFSSSSSFSPSFELAFLWR